MNSLNLFFTNGILGLTFFIALYSAAHLNSFTKRYFMFSIMAGVLLMSGPLFFVPLSVKLSFSVMVIFLAKNISYLINVEHAPIFSGSSEKNIFMAIYLGLGLASIFALRFDFTDFLFTYPDLLAALVPGIIILLLVLPIIFKKELTRALGLFALGGIVVVINQLPYHLLIGQLLLFISTMTIAEDILKEAKTEKSLMEDELGRLQNDFNWEVKKEARLLHMNMQEHHEHLKQKSLEDPMTSTLNRRGFNQVINRLMMTKNSRFSIIMYDIDSFKTINDTFGHDTGDKSIKQLSLYSKMCLRDGDYLSRFGGDEFVVILPGQDIKTAISVANRIREKVSQNTDPAFTISCGVATFPMDAVTLDKLIEVADDGLYHSKNHGKNRVSYAKELK